MHALTKFLVSLFALPLLSLAEIPIKNGEKVAFLGDSITAGGYSQATGYVQLVGKGLAANGVTIEIIGAGISGHKSNQMLERLERDVLSKKPNWMTLSCGVNDVWHGPKGVLLEDYKKNITAIIDRAQAAGIKVMVLTSTMIKEDQASQLNQQLIPYNDFLRTIAAEKKCLLADLNADMQKAVATAHKTSGNKGNILTNDGVHMIAEGNLLMATGVLQAFGLDKAEMTKANEVFQTMPNFSSVTAKTNLTLRQKLQLEKIAAEQKTTVDAMIAADFQKYVDSLLEKSAK
jgi:lysophospholipase L1-like esterase